MSSANRAHSYPIPSFLPDFAPSVGIDPELVHKSNNDHYPTGR